MLTTNPIKTKNSIVPNILNLRIFNNLQQKILIVGFWFSFLNQNILFESMKIKQFILGNSKLARRIYFAFCCLKMGGRSKLL